MRIVEISDEQGTVREPGWLARSEAVHRQLRPHLGDYAATMVRVLAGGARMIACTDGADVLGVAVYRLGENTANGLHLYVDDLVTDAARRSQGVGAALLAWLEARARERGCALLDLDSGTQRHAAHRFYFRERFTVSSFHFVKPLQS